MGKERKKSAKEGKLGRLKERWWEGKNAVGEEEGVGEVKEQENPPQRLFEM